MSGHDPSGCVYACVGSLFVLYVLMALRMSFYRLAGSPGEDKPNSPLNRFYEIQMLTAEWVPIGAILSLALLYKGTLPGYYIECLVGAFTIARVAFVVVKLYVRIHVAGVISMVTCYVATLLMALALIFV
uniref:Uncharacterized protein n=1 Tax=Neobodo designis TaxID=312471 RepID=A0A7S1QVY1_NEODS|mmetsp:Transcript_5339/g.16897  ORF Transcript_5339/g.16897 Transcript_5339/m.16897 type:complete len:130 (+) Transcript_5339:39-428(+)|eukprot:CAMPEP_0174855022 /NCGR_PEP_ID=MMETSP1114-20130205/32271_1 /TAXON_ID=312471 /ORGANISM="Neobodo designis, Strain CCAP 1951/1" /LENGTH=129 /DNA_ID=CAMNT_0016089733 /DNA_START=34 /DNA_END=423 /DNA_ORIENTATION=+